MVVDSGAGQSLQADQVVSTLPPEPAPETAGQPPTVEEARERILFTVARLTAYTAGVSNEPSSASSSSDLISALDALVHTVRNEQNAVVKSLKAEHAKLLGSWREYDACLQKIASVCWTDNDPRNERDVTANIIRELRDLQRQVTSLAAQRHASAQEIARLQTVMNQVITEAEAIEAALKTRLQQAEAHLAAQGWQPIETAPKDGTQILLWINGIEPRPRISFWSERGRESGWYSVQSHHFIGSIVTHWQPLPLQPTTSGDI